MDPPPQRMEWMEGRSEKFLCDKCLSKCSTLLQGLCYVLSQGAGQDKGSQQSLKQPTAGLAPTWCSWSKIMMSLNKQSNQHPLYPARQVSLLSTDITLGTVVGKLPARHAKQLLPLIKWVDGILQVVHTVHKGTVHRCWLFHYNKTCKESNKYQTLMHICGI